MCALIRSPCTGCGFGRAVDCAEFLRSECDPAIKAFRELYSYVTDVFMLRLGNKRATVTCAMCEGYCCSYVAQRRLNIRGRLFDRCKIKSTPNLASVYFTGPIAGPPLSDRSELGLASLRSCVSCLLRSPHGTERCVITAAWKHMTAGCAGECVRRSACWSFMLMAADKAGPGLCDAHLHSWARNPCPPAARAA
ncbi:unnamed protein product, partial [Iphiclides podalirius]